MSPDVLDEVVFTVGAFRAPVDADPAAAAATWRLFRLTVDTAATVVVRNGPVPLLTDPTRTVSALIVDADRLTVALTAIDDDTTVTVLTDIGVFPTREDAAVWLAEHPVAGHDWCLLRT